MIPRFSQKDRTLAKHTLISELAGNAFITGVYAIQNCQLGQTKNGKPYIKCLLADKSGRTPGRMWSVTEELFATLPTDGFVWIEGQSQPYQGEMQIVIMAIRPAKPTIEELADLLPTTKFPIDEMFLEFKRILHDMKDPACLALAQMYLDDEVMMARFQRAPAASNLHHAFIGGLLEHTLALLRLAKAVCPLYPQINEDVVLMGLLLHDLGKTVELTWEQGFGYSDDGQLVGHVARGVIWLERMAEKAKEKGHKIPPALIMVLHHIILSHHGKAEFGALKLPSTPEAILVSLLDNVDAKTHMAIAAARSDTGKASELGGNFTEKVWALETRLYRPDPTKMPT